MKRTSDEDTGSQGAHDPGRLRCVRYTMRSRYLETGLKLSFYRVVKSIKDAIREGIHPKMITKGSSGSYFARAKVDGRVQTIA